MKVSNDHNYSSKNSSKKGMTLNALDTIETISDSIDKLISLVSKMNMKMDNVKPSTNQKFIKVKGEDRKNVTTDKTTIKLEIGHTVEIGIHLIEAEEILTEIIYQIIDVRSRDKYRWDRYRQNVRCDDYRQDYRRDNCRNNYRQDYG